MNRQNLIPRHRLEAWRVRRRINAWAMTLLTLAMLVGGLVVGGLLTQASPPAMPVGLIDKTEQVRSQLALAREQIRVLRQQEQARERASLVPDWDALLALLTQEAAGTVRLKAIRTQRVQGSTPAWTVSIVGTAPTRQAPAALAGRLEATGLFGNVRHGLGSASSGDGSFEFFIDCAIAPGGEP